MRNVDFDFLYKSAIIVILWSTPPLVSERWIDIEGTFPGLYFGFLRYFLGFIALLFIIIVYNRNLVLLKQILWKQPHIILLCGFWLGLMIIGTNFSVLFVLSLLHIL